MAASDERVRLDIGFKGGATLTVAVTVPEADALEQRLRQGGDGGLVELDADDGRLLVVTAHVLYIRRHARGSRVGFSAAT
jgi:hypothetical protein